MKLKIKQKEPGFGLIGAYDVWLDDRKLENVRSVELSKIECDSVTVAKIDFMPTDLDVDIDVQKAFDETIKEIESKANGTFELHGKPRNIEECVEELRKTNKKMKDCMVASYRGTI